MPKAPQLRAHQEWLGYLQPVGGVMSPPAFTTAQAAVDSNVLPLHTGFREWVESGPPGSV